MDKRINIKIRVETTIIQNIENVWECWTLTVHVAKWNHASDDGYTPFEGNNLIPGGRFLYRMEAKDKSDGFNFSGTYDEVEPFKRISYILDDG